MNRSVRIALIGAGRMGQRHAAILATLRGATLARVCDPSLDLAQRVSAEYGGEACESVDEVLRAGDFDAVIVASPTETHVDFVMQFAHAGVPVFCEKPLALDLGAAAKCCSALRGAPAVVQMGFNRRYDSGHSALARAVRAGEIGSLEFCSLTSRDFSPPPDGYLARSGGIFRDMMIHDFDMVRFVTGDEPVSVCAMGGALFLPDAKRHDDVDTVAIVLKLASGAIAQINGSRRAIYGHDQRIEVVGEHGMLISQNVTEDALERFTAQGTGLRGQFVPSSRDRYREAYRAEVEDFIRCIVTKGQPVVTLDDGYQALRIAEAADRSMREGRIVAMASEPAMV